MDDFELQMAALRAAYWRLRAERQTNKRRRWYRLAAKEKGRLAALGFDRDVVRLYCLWLRDPSLEYRYHRFRAALDEAQNGPKQLCLF